MTPRESASAGLRTFYQRGHRLLDSLMKVKGASFAQARLLAFIRENEATRSADIVSTLGMAPRTVTAAVDALEREGLVERKRFAGDRRSKLLSVTDKGLAALQSTEPAKRQFFDELYGALSDDEAATLARLIEKLTDRLESMAADVTAQNITSGPDR